MTDINAVYYETPQPGRDDYWDRMAAPRFRVATILNALGTFPWTSLVDLGCGNGALLREIRVPHPRSRLGGVDLSRRQIEANKEKLPGFEWRAQDLTKAPEEPPGPPFDVAVASEIIEHVEDPGQFLKTAARWTGPRGRIFLSTQSGPVRETERRVGHRRHFSIQDMESLLSAAGWRPLSLWNCGYPFHDWSKRVANWFPGAAMANFSGRPYGLPQRLVCAALRGAFRFNSRKRGAQLFALAEKIAP